MKTPLCSWLYVLLLNCYTIVLLGANLRVVSSQCEEDQKSWLLQLKSNFQFSPSGKLAAWNPSADCCVWSGVTCDASGLVTELDLSNEYISATNATPNWSSLSYLKNLQTLNLSFNKFNSTIPPGLDQLPNLMFLNLSYAGFAGQIPLEISRMTRLVSLDLSSYSYLSGLPPLKLENPNLATLLGNLSQLLELHLDGINISANGYEWCHVLSSSLPKLRVLSLSHCSLSGPMDSSLLNLQSLSVIHLGYNSLSAPVPDFLAGFSNMTSLSLASSGLYGEFPKRIFQVSTLQTIDLSDNQELEGELPAFPRNGSLRTLKLSGTCFSGRLSDSIGNLKMLSRIELSSCSFSGSIPKSVENLTQLVYLDFSLNGFNGSVPSFSKSKNLTHIYLSHNGFWGQIPPVWEGLQYLVNLALNNNSLSGSIPEFLFSLPSLQRMELSNNEFSGRLRVWNESSAHVLTSVDLSSNKLGGPIPVSLFELRGLAHLSLSSNNFSGSLQLDVLQQLMNLSYFDISHNSLSVDVTDSRLFFPHMTTFRLASCKLRSFPEFLRNQSMLSHLDLSINKIQGSIPNWIWKIDLAHLNLSFNSLMNLEAPIPNNMSLVVLDLHSNQLQGPIPILTKSAAFWDYSANNFSSPIPSDIGDFLPFAIFFSLSSNNFHGDIPESVCNASFLRVLDLSNNSLTGMIPDCLMAMSSTLGVMNLRRNNLRGNIDDSFPHNCTLKTLDLSGNQLQGKVPKSLANCQWLEVLNFRSNLMHDTFPCHLKNRATSLRVLVLRSNQFYGHIGCPMSSGTWQMLQIVDLASNKFGGKLPGDELKTWQAMVLRKNKTELELKHIQYEFLTLSRLYFDDVVTVANKGLQMELVKILTVFTSIDLSSNRFEGPIPQEVGDFKLLYVLNLSHNVLTGEIPSALGNLAKMESLDLSFNHLDGTIPAELARLNFLSFLNLSSNQLVGRIPLGSQLQTFEESSFKDNLALCGAPLKAACSTPESSPESPEEGSGSLFDWQFMYGGVLGIGLGSGVVVGALLFTTRGSKWCDSFMDQVHFGILHPSLFVHTLLDRCRPRRSLQ